jgi:ParB family transcriptional regulator, chromosome partitioning protein
MNALQAVEPGVVSEWRDGRDLVYLALAEILQPPSDMNSRLAYNETALEELAESIREHGVLQPILVRPIESLEGSEPMPSTNGQSGKHRYILIAGNRRFQAAKRARLHHIPALIRITNGDESFVLNVVENIQRENLSGRERVRAITLLANLREVGGESMSTRRVAALIKKDHTTIAKWLGIHREPLLRDAVADGSLKIGHAMKLVGAPRESLPELIAAAASISQPELQSRVTELRSIPRVRARRAAEANHKRVLTALRNLSCITKFEPLDPESRQGMQQVLALTEELLRA